MKHKDMLLRLGFLLATVNAANSQVTPVMVGHAAPGGLVVNVTVSNNYAFVANDTNGLWIYDVSRPAAPVVIGHVNNGGAAYCVAVSGNYAYLANRADGLRVYDISVPSNPTNVAHPNAFAGSATGVSVVGHYCYVANGLDGLRIFDVSNPANPVSIGNVNESPHYRFAVNVAISGNYAYLANFGDGFRVYDISDPSNPSNAGHIPTQNSGDSPTGIAVSGDYALLAEYKDVRVFDVSNPNVPVSLALMGAHPNPDYPSLVNVTVSGNYAYLANGYKGFVIYDISSPNLPVLVGHSVTNYGGWTGAIAVSGNYLYAANGSDGLRIYWLGPPSPKLDIILSDRNALQLSWPISTNAFVLQQNSDPFGASWSDITNAPIVIGAKHQVTITRSGDSRFFRLKLP